MLEKIMDFTLGTILFSFLLVSAKNIITFIEFSNFFLNDYIQSINERP